MKGKAKAIWQYLQSYFESVDKLKICQLIFSILGLLILLWFLWAFLTDETSFILLMSRLVFAIGYLMVVIFFVQGKWDRRLWLFTIIVILAVSVLLIQRNWDELRTEQESISTTINNLGFLIGGAVAILLAVWRSIVAESQSETAQKSLLNERYQKGAEMLGNNVLSVRLGGIYALQRLAMEHPAEYHIQIMRLFCALARNPTDDKNGRPLANEEVKPRDNRPRLREDIEAVVEAIRIRSMAGIRLERNECYRLGLKSADLRGARLMGADLSRAVLSGADLSGARLDDANLSGSWLDKTNLASAWLGGANLSGADLWSTNLSGAFLVLAPDPDDEEDKTDWKPVRGLTQENLDWACGDTEPLYLNRVIDPETEEPLQWRGKPCN